MRPTIIHSIIACLATLLLTVACAGPEEPVSDNAEAVLYLNVAPMGSSRASTAEFSDMEKMTSLRVLVLHEDGTVEHNVYYPPQAPLDSRKILLKVTPDEKKTVFLFANEESVADVRGVAAGNMSLTEFFSKYNAGVSGFADAVNGLWFAPDFTEGKPLPMSSMYEVDFPAEGSVEETFYLVRAATKFVVNFRSWRAEEVEVSRFTIASHADMTYLMAHVNDSRQNRELFGGKTWIDWLKDVSERSSENDDYATTDAAGWLKDYEVPSAADLKRIFSHDSPIKVSPSVINIDYPENSRPGTAEPVTLYLPESKNLKEGATDGEQQYTMTFTIDGTPEPFVFTLPNLKALFRNTNVIVNVTMYKDLEIAVDVIPFTPVNLQPDFGLNREDFTGYVIGTDTEGRRCWYDHSGTRCYLGPKGSEGAFVTINGDEYLLVYTDYERTAAGLNHFFDTDHGIHRLTPQDITGYKVVKDAYGSDMYINHLNQRVNLDSDLYKAKYNSEWSVCRTLDEWERADWNLAYWDGNKTIRPRYWFDILGKRYPWSEGKTAADRRKKIGDWAKYLE